MLVSLKSRSGWWIGVFIVINVAIGALFAKGAAGWLPVAASCLATVAVFRMRGVVMRFSLLICTLLWLANNILSGSVGGTVLEAIIAGVNLATIVRLLAEVRQTRREKAAAAVPQPVSV
jgi:hypothetical protein